MALMKTSNPALGDKTFRDLANGGQFGGVIDAAGRMTLAGTVNKTGILLLCTLATACYTWKLFLDSRDFSSVGGLMILGLIGGFIVAMVTIFKQQWAPITAPIYALLEGLALGGISASLEVRYPGIAIQAVALTFGTMFVLLIAYRSGLIKVTEKFKLGIIAATGGIAVLYLAEMVLGLFHVNAFAAINGSSPVSILFSLFVVTIAALNLVLDFDYIEQGVAVGAPKYMEWYCGFSLMVTLIWLYLEIIRLLSKLRSRN
jgi:uncharacterized YccA/Bax inhibitor family protein